MMPETPRPNDPDRKTLQDQNVDEMWHKFLTGGEPSAARMRHLFGLIPANPRCKLCHAPFHGFGGQLMRVIGKTPSTKNPQFCMSCEMFASSHQGSAEVELSMLFVHVRGSTTLAEIMNPTEFSRLMNFFYKEAIYVLI